MANCLHQFLHPIMPPANDSLSMPGNIVSPTITNEMASTSSPIINARQIIEQLSTLLQQANSAMPTTNQNNPSNNSDNDAPDVDELLSAASDQAEAPTSNIPALINTVGNRMPMHMQPIITQSISGQTHVQPTAIQSSLPPVPPRIWDRVFPW